MNTEFLKKLGLKIKELRLLENISREELAFRVGVSGSYIGMLERGEKNFKICILNDLAKGLNCSLKDIIE